MSDKPIEEKVKDIIVEQLGVNPEQVTPNASFIEDLGADSLDIVELVMAFEEEFSVEVPDEDAEKLQTVGYIDDDILAYAKFQIFSCLDDDLLAYVYSHIFGYLYSLVAAHAAASVKLYGHGTAATDRKRLIRPDSFVPTSSDG